MAGGAVGSGGGSPLSGGNAGASGATASGGGAQSGTGDGEPGRCVQPGDVAPIALTVFYTDQTVTGQIGMRLTVSNAGSDYPMSDLVLRYWFTAGALTGFVSNVDYAALIQEAQSIAANVNVSFGEAFGSYYADINIIRPDPIGMGIESLQLRIHTPNFDILNHTDDFSYVADATDVVNQNITAYVSGEQVFGCEPSI